MGLIWDCFQKMREIRDFIRQPKLHKKASMVVLNVISHGTSDGLLKSTEEGGFGLHIQDIIGTLRDVKTLQGKPKLLFINTCRGSEYS